MTAPELIRRAQVATGLSLGGIARTLHVDRSTVSRWVSGRMVPDGAGMWALWALGTCPALAVQSSAAHPPVESAP